jgi:hypothetical protein
VFTLIVVCIAIFLISNWIHNYRKPTRKGKTDAKLTKSYEVQVSADRVIRPNQGSSQSSSNKVAGLLYLISNRELNSLKIGISRIDSDNDRIQNHQQYGWQLEKCWNFDDHANAQQVEGATIAWWRNHLKFGPSVSRQDMPQGGYTETVSLNEISFSEVNDYVSILCANANGKEAINVSIRELIVGAVMQTNGILEYAATRTRTAKFKGDYQWHYKYYKWQQWVISNNGSKLTIELNQRNSTPLKNLRIGGRVDVVGRVESVDGELRMTNPEYMFTGKRLLSKKTLQHTNKSRKSRTKSPAHEKKALFQFDKPAAVTRQKYRVAPLKPKTAFEKAMNKTLESELSVNSSLLAERCSACGALVANGASHDCR